MYGIQNTSNLIGIVSIVETCLIIVVLLIYFLNIQLSLLLNISIFLLLFLFVFIIKPYMNMKHTIFFCVSMIVCMTIQGIYLAYKMGVTNENSKANIWIILPLVVCILFLLFVIYGFVFLVI